MAVLLNKQDMAASIGISTQAFDRWGVEPVERRGREVFYDVKSVLQAERKRQQEKGQITEEDDDAELRLLLARIELTEEQAVAQRLKNKVMEGELIDVGFCSFALSRLAMDLSSVLDSIPLSMQRKFPDMSPAKIKELKGIIAKGANQCARLGEKLPELLDEYIKQADK
ncbi:phage DNA packaging protein Nu1 [Edwardsiella tarda ATCC 23685]|uniref:Phage DNA packaging protein Nu1 n=1 Tax=Edwardsiella tarda ATCC 23685 TaxID=500638 RepID=D4F557_EDWTA|nr:terminase small subunit [Edwardsiella tarda]ATI62799.1 DNA-packaging protein [Edwardsiella tarda]EFE23084.1 phage DNA packaging protein Nu1 [Edwardsiella tarda ATCC 23685]GAC63425.1 putative prophage DNA-packaging protein [Edwardsiella tarda ATCC 15947 = NBRC 105688]STD45894.1 Phage DNA packaging protein Nu1 [Edwardsiella tarda]